MIDRGTLMIDVDGEVTGQVNGLAVYAVGGGEPILLMPGPHRWLSM